MGSMLVVMSEKACIFMNNLQRRIEIIDQKVNKISFSLYESEQQRNMIVNLHQSGRRHWDN
jgi:hypothetical protein